MTTLGSPTSSCFAVTRAAGVVVTAAAAALGRRRLKYGLAEESPRGRNTLTDDLN